MVGAIPAAGGDDLMDVGMPELNGFEATRQLLKALPDLKIIGLSMHVDERFVGEMLRAGAVGYVCKKCDADDVIAAVFRNVV